MSVKAVFQVEGVTKRKGWGGHPYIYDVNLRAIADKDKVYEGYSAATPSGELRMSVLNELAANQFEPGENYFLTFEKAN